jgi:hypothetical protein
MEDWFKLIREVYVDNGLITLEAVLAVYAPSFENDTELYMSQTMSRVEGIMWESRFLKDETLKLETPPQTGENATAQIDFSYGVAQQRDERNREK